MQPVIRRRRWASLGLVSCRAAGLPLLGTRQLGGGTGAWLQVALQERDHAVAAAVDEFERNALELVRQALEAKIGKSEGHEAVATAVRRSRPASRFPHRIRREEASPGRDPLLLETTDWLPTRFRALRFSGPPRRGRSPRIAGSAKVRGLRVEASVSALSVLPNSVYGCVVSNVGHPTLRKPRAQGTGAGPSIAATRSMTSGPLASGSEHRHSADRDGSGDTSAWSSTEPQATH